MKARAVYIGPHGLVARDVPLPLFALVGSVAIMLEPHRLVLTHTTWKRGTRGR